MSKEKFEFDIRIRNPGWHEQKFMSGAHIFHNGSRKKSSCTSGPTTKAFFLSGPALTPPPPTSKWLDHKWRNFSLRLP